MVGPFSTMGSLPSSHVNTGEGMTNSPASSSRPVPVIVDGAPEHTPAESSLTSIS